MSELEQIIDVLFDDPTTIPDMNIISHIAAGSERPIGLLKDVVYILWLASERPDEFDEMVKALG